MADYDISIKPGDFIDQSTLLARAPGPCFICGKSTWCIDIDFQGYFCDSQRCNDHITCDLIGNDAAIFCPYCRGHHGVEPLASSFCRHAD